MLKIISKPDGDLPLISNAFSVLTGCIYILIGSSRKLVSPEGQLVSFWLDVVQSTLVKMLQLFELKQLATDDVIKSLKDI